MFLVEVHLFRLVKMIPHTPYCLFECVVKNSSMHVIERRRDFHEQLGGDTQWAVTNPYNMQSLPFICINVFMNEASGSGNRESLCPTREPIESLK